MIDIQNAIIQMQARATNQLFNVLNMHTEQESAPVELDKVIELQGDVLEKLKEGLLEHISVEELRCTKDQLHRFVELEALTAEEYKEITGDTYEEV